MQVIAHTPFNLRKLIGQLLHKSSCYWLGHDDTKITNNGTKLNIYRNWRCCNRCGRCCGD